MVDAVKQGSLLPSLTSLRFGAALLVFARHLQPLFESIGVGGTKPFLLQGASGVSFFFLLSGFILMWTQREDLPARAFYRNRFARVWPTHAATWVIALFIAAVTAGGTTAWVAGVNLVLLQSWFPSSSVYLSANTVSWSLSCEALFYLLFPVFVIVAARTRRPVVLMTAAVIAFGLIASAVLLAPIDGELKVWIVTYFPPVRALEFLAGMLACAAVRSERLPRIPLVPALIGMAAVYVAAGFAPARISLVTHSFLLIFPFLAVVVAAAQRDISGASGMMHRPWALALGEWSFAFYLVHLMVIERTRAVLDDDTLLAVLAVAAIALTVSVGVAWLLHRFVEKPSRQRLRTNPARTLRSPAVA